MFVDENDLFISSGNGLRIGLGESDLVAGSLCQLVQAGLVLVVSGDLLQAAAGEVLKAGVHQLHADFVIVVPAGLMGVEGSGSGMIQVYGADHADLPALLGMELLRDGLIGSGTAFVHIDHAGIGLFAGGDRGGGGSGVRGKGAGVVGHGGAGSLEAHKVQRHRAVQDRAFPGIQLGAGQSLFIIIVGNGTKIVGSGLELRIAHAIANEQEHIFGCVPFCRCRGCGAEGQGAKHSEGKGQRCHAGVEFFHVLPP